MIIINRYSNRKLYDTKAKKYITLKGIVNLLNEGNEIKVIDKLPYPEKTKEPLKDITVETVTRAFFQAGLFHNTVRDFLNLKRKSKEIENEG